MPSSGPTVATNSLVIDNSGAAARWYAVFRHGEILFTAVLVLLSVLSWYPRREGSLDLRWDGSVYYVLGTSLAQGTGYRLLNEPGEIQANQYPPLLPLLIAAHQKIAGTSDPFIVGPWLKLTAVVFSTLVIVLTYLLLRHFLRPLWAGCGALMVVLNLPAYLHFNMVSAELLFALALLLFLLAHYRMQGLPREAAGGLAAAAMFLSRSVGIVVYAAWIGEAVLQRQFRTTALRVIGTAVCVVPWYAYINAVELSPEYTHSAYTYQRADYLYYNVTYARNMKYIDPYRPELGTASHRDLINRIVHNVRVAPKLVGEAVSSYRSFWIGQATAVNARTGVGIASAFVVDAILFVIGCITLGGMVWLGARGDRLIPLYVLATLTAVVTTPWPLQHVRYLSPSVPVLLLGLFTSLSAAEMLAARIGPRLRHIARGVAVCFVTLILVQQAATYFQAHTRYLISSNVTAQTGAPVVYKQLFYYLENVAMDECITWIAKHANRDDIIAASMAHWVYLRTGLKTVMPPLEPDAATANNLLDSVPVRYIIQETPSFYAARYVSNAVQADPARWRLAYVAPSDDVRVYERVLDH